MESIRPKKTFTSQDRLAKVVGRGKATPFGRIVPRIVDPSMSEEVELDFKPKSMKKNMRYKTYEQEALARILGLKGI